MKKLYIIRHGKSDWKAGIRTDFERPLNDRGMEDAPNMGKHLKSNYDKPDLIISSPAVRALTTARLIAHEVGFPLKNIIEDESIYEAPLHDLLLVIGELPDDKNIIYLFGHNPGVSMLTDYLTDEYVDMKTSNVAVVSADIDSWKMASKGLFQLKAFLSPKTI